MCVVDVVPPSVFLPPLKLVKTCSDEEISHVITSLRRIYLPEVRGSSHRRYEQRSRAAVATDVLCSHLTLGSHNMKEKPERNGLSAIRADPFERTFAVQWLTRFVSLFSEVVANSPDFLAVTSQALEEAASLLAVCAGSAASGAVTRTFTFPFSNGVKAGSPDNLSTGHEEMDGVDVVVRDAPLESNDFSSVGAQTWGGSCILAEMISENPQNFSIYPREDAKPNTHSLHVDTPLRALELGAGTGLASVVLGKVLGRIRGVHCLSRENNSSKSHQAAWNVDTVIATDIHPSVLANLRFNFAVNFPSQIFNSQTHVDDDARILRSSETLELRPNMLVLPLDWSVIYSLAHPISSSPRIGSSLTFSETEDELTNQISTLDRDTTSYNIFNVNTSFHSQAQIQGLDQTETQLSDDNANAQTIADPCPIAPQLDILFDLIIGADIIYEVSHARWVRSCVERFLRKPTRPFSEADSIPMRASAAAPRSYSPSDPLPLLVDRHPTTALFHLIIPLRHTHAVECHSVEEVFSRAGDILLSRRIIQKGSEPAQSSNTFDAADQTGIPRHRGEPMVLSVDGFSYPVPLELAIISQEDISCYAYSDREEEVVYRYYRIGWV